MNQHTMQNYRHLFFLIFIIVSIATSLEARVIRDYEGMSESLEISIIKLSHERPRVRQDAVVNIKKMNLSDDKLLLAWAELTRVLTATDYRENIELSIRSRDAIFGFIDLDEALGGLLSLLDSENKDESILARFAIKEIGEALEGSIIKPMPGTVTLLVKTLNAQDVQTREIVIHLLGVIPSHAEAALPGLINALTDEHYVVRSAAISTLGKLAVAIPAVHPEILKALMNLIDENQEVLDALGVLKGIAKEIPEIQLEIAEKMIEMLNAPNFVLPTHALKHDSNFHVRVAGCLQSIGGAAVPLLVKAINVGDAGVRHHAAIALAKIGSEHDEATIPILTEALASPYRATRGEAIHALRTLGERPTLVYLITPIFVEVLKTTKDMEAVYYGLPFHKTVARALAHINLPAMSELLRSENPFIRNLAVSTIAQEKQRIKSLEAVKEFEKRNSNSSD